MILEQQTPEVTYYYEAHYIDDTTNVDSIDDILGELKYREVEDWDGQLVCCVHKVEDMGALIDYLDECVQNDHQGGNFDTYYTLKRMSSRDMQVNLLEP